MGADLLHMSPLLLQDVSTGDMDPLLKVVEVYLTVRERGRREEGGREGGRHVGASLFVILIAQLSYILYGVFLTLCSP